MKNLGLRSNSPRTSVYVRFEGLVVLTCHVEVKPEIKEWNHGLAPWNIPAKVKNIYIGLNHPETRTLICHIPGWLHVLMERYNEDQGLR